MTTVSRHDQPTLEQFTASLGITALRWQGTVGYRRVDADRILKVELLVDCVVQGLPASLGEPAPALEPGQVVELNSGSHAMTFERYREDGSAVVRWARDGKIASTVLASELLSPVANRSEAPRDAQ